MTETTQPMPFAPEAQPEHAVTQLLIDWKSGNKQALDLLIPLVYQELLRLADHYLRDERSAATLQRTALVHEAYVRLVAQNLPDWESRAHFFGVAAHLMRQILVDHARRRHSSKRGSGVRNVPLEEAVSFSRGRGRDIQQLDEALTALAAFDERKAKVIELRFFGGLSVEEIAQSVGVSVATVGREQRVAQAWLLREMAGIPNSGE